MTQCSPGTLAARQYSQPHREAAKAGFKPPVFLKPFTFEADREPKG